MAPRPAGGRAGCVSAGRGPRLSRREERPQPAMAAGPPARHRSAPDLGAGRHHQLRHLRSCPPAACIRPCEGLGQPDHAACEGRRDDRRARRRGIHAGPHDDRDRRRCRRRGHRRHHGRGGVGRLGDDDRRVSRSRPVRSGAHRDDRAQARHHVRRALPVRARGRSAKRRMGRACRNADDPRYLRRRSLRADDRRRHARVAARGDLAQGTRRRARRARRAGPPGRRPSAANPSPAARWPRAA